MLLRFRPLALLLALVLVAVACNPARQGGGTQTTAPASTPQSSPGGSPGGSGAGPGANLSGNLQVWFYGTDNPTAQAKDHVWKRHAPNVTTRYTGGGFDAQKFLTAVAGGNPPDLVHIPRNVLGSYAARGALIPLDDHIASAKVDMSQFYEAARREVQLGGKTYGLPQFQNIRVAYLNQSALTDAGLDPATVDLGDWPALQQLATRLVKNEGGKVTRVGFDPKVPEFMPLWIAANGGSVLDAEGTESLLDSAEVIEALTFAAGLREAQGGQAKLAAFVQGLGDFGQAENPFTTDAVAATLYEQWLVNPLAQNAPETDIVIKPFVKKGTDEAITYADGLAWAIPKGAPNPELAFEFARFMVSPDAWVEGAKAAKEDRELLGGLYLGSYTANRAADERIFTEVYKPTGKKQWDDAVQVIRGLQDKAVTLPASAAGAEVLAALDKAVLQVLTGKATPEAALKAADQEAQTALDRAASGG